MKKSFIFTNHVHLWSSLQPPLESCHNTTPEIFPYNPKPSLLWQYGLWSFTLYKSNRLLPKSEISNEFLRASSFGFIVKGVCPLLLPLVSLSFSEKIYPKFFKDIFVLKYLKIKCQNLTFFKAITPFHFQKYWSLLWTHSLLG